MDEYSKLLYALAGVGVSGFVGWTVNSISNLKLKVRELEIRGDDVAEMKNDLKILTSLVWEIAGKLGIPIRRD